MTRIQLAYQDGTATDMTASGVSWVHIRDSLGVHLFQNGDLCFDNGVGNAGVAGTVYFREIAVDGKPLCEPGEHCFDPRRLLPVRRSGLRVPPRQTAHLPHERPEWVQKGTETAKALQDALRLGVARPDLDLYFPRMGPWMPMTKAGPQPGGTGGTGLDFLPGWERVSALTLLRADAVAQGMAVAYVDAATGFPLPRHHQERYDHTRGWAKVTQLAEFCAPATLDPYDDRRIPRAANAGWCPYEYTLAGVDRYSGCCPRDGQHLIRGYSDALAGWQVYSDPLCGFYLSVVAADAALRWHGTPPGIAAQQGYGNFGREAGWVLHCLTRDGHIEGDTLDRAFRYARMTGSVHQRTPADGYQGSTDIYQYADSGQYVMQSIEASICGYACSEVVEVALAITAEGNPSKFLIVEPGQPPKLDKRAAYERETYNVWALVGRALQYATPAQRATLLDRTTRMTLPNDGRTHATPEDLYAAAVANGETTVMVPLVKGLETVLG